MNSQKFTQENGDSTVKSNGIEQSLPDIWKLEFKSPYENGGQKRYWYFKRNEYDVPGIILIRSNDGAIDIHYAAVSIYARVREIITYYCKYKGKVSVAAVVLPQVFQPVALTVDLVNNIVRNEVMKAYYHYHKQVAKIPLDNSYNEVMEALRAGVKSEDILKKISFRKPYVENFERKRKCNFERSTYFYRSGIYLIKRDGEIVYVGAATQSWYARMYSHFTPFACVDRRRPDKKIVQYYSELREHDFEVGIIEIPGVISSGGITAELQFEKIKDYAHELEDLVIKLFDPIDNRPEPVSPVSEVAEDNESPPF